MYVGLSLSFCVRDIIEGKVPLEEVEKIITSTAAPDEETWSKLIRDYCQYYWSKNPDEAVRITRQLLAEGRIEQPRLSGEIGNNIVGGHWLRDGQLVPRH